MTPFQVLANRLAAGTLTIPDIQGAPLTDEQRRSLFAVFLDSVNGGGSKFVPLASKDQPNGYVGLDENGDLEASIKLDDVSGEVLAPQTIGWNENKGGLVQGDGTTTGGVQVSGGGGGGGVGVGKYGQQGVVELMLAPEPTDTEVNVTVGNNKAVQWWDGTVDYNTGGGDTVLTKAIPLESEPYGGMSPKRILSWSINPDKSIEPGTIYIACDVSTPYVNVLDYYPLAALGAALILKGVRYLDSGGIPFYLLSLRHSFINPGIISSIDANISNQLSFSNCESIADLNLIDLAPVTSLINVQGLEKLTVGISSRVPDAQVDSDGPYLSAFNCANCFSLVVLDTIPGTLLLANDYAFNNSALETDAIYEFIDLLGDSSPYAPSIAPVIRLNGNPCVVADVLIDGATHTAAETIALAASKGIAFDTTTTFPLVYP